MPSVFDLVFYAWASISFLAFIVASYKVAYHTTHVVEDVRAAKTAEAKQEWSTESYQMKAARWKMVRWYLTWGLAPLAIALFWLPAIPAFMGHNTATNEKKEKEALEEGMHILESYYAKAEIEAAEASGREPLLDLTGVMPDFLKKTAKGVA